MYKSNARQFARREMIYLGVFAILGVVELPLLFLFGFGAWEALQPHCMKIPPGALMPGCWPPNFSRFFLILIASSLTFGTYIAAIATKSDRYRRIFTWANFVSLFVLFSVAWIVNVS